MELPNPREGFSYTERNIACLAAIYGENAGIAICARDEGDIKTARLYAKRAREYLGRLKSWASKKQV
jgi:hypothetical protein